MASNYEDAISIIECPRDAMQGIHRFISTEQKIRYINRLLKVGFHTIDVGSFVSPKAIPQMRDTAEVLEKIEWKDSKSKLLTIVANERGALDAIKFPQVHFLGYPFSISEEFQKRNTNKSIDESLQLVKRLQEICTENDKSLVVYISMGFGNPYGESWSPDLVEKWARELAGLGVKILSLSDTVGMAKTHDIQSVFNHLIPALPEVTFGAHLHTPYEDWHQKVEAAYAGGCRRFDGAIRGFGGCPMAKDDLVGNMPTEKLVTFAENHKLQHGLNTLALETAYNAALDIFY
ncbi:MAG: hydroxymethylglutaryl-CoA lyase [Cryomorphaceae bacterium]|nr:hydroxymethylglutaryl-CoA lyase [Cryomorphaceae bacterium]